MRKAILTIATLSLMAPMLGGCNSVGQLFGLHKQAKPADRVEPASHAEAQMALGKQRLDDGQFGSAIEAFSNARQDPDQAAGAFNGLAIAYAQLGRPDLAERFFKQAMATDPANRRYQANLARFYATVEEVAVSKTRDEQTALALEMPVPNQAFSVTGPVRVQERRANPAITVQTPANRIARVSGSAVMIGKVQSPQAVVTTSDGRRRLAQAVQAVASETVRRPNPQYPVKFGFAPAAPLPASKRYPVRVGFSQIERAFAVSNERTARANR